jgi:SAM-dependent methyltransferase
MTELLDVLRCPVCRSRLEPDDDLRCTGCGRRYDVEDGIPRLLDDSLPGIAAKRREIDGWLEKAKRENWYREDDEMDEIDAGLPHVSWDDPVWRSNEHSFGQLLEHYVRPGMLVLEVGAARCWAAQHLLPRGCEYVGTDILADPVIGLGRGAFYAERVGGFGRVQADGERLPFADGVFDLTFCVATLHHALDLTAMVHEMARVTKPGGFVAGLNEGTRALGASSDAPLQREERALGINEHVHTVWAYLWSFARAGLVVRRVIPADGVFAPGRAAKLLRLPRGETLTTLAVASRHDYGGITLFASKGIRPAKLRAIRGT